MYGPNKVVRKYGCFEGQAQALYVPMGSVLLSIGPDQYGAMQANVLVDKEATEYDYMYLTIIQPERPVPDGCEFINSFVWNNEDLYAFVSMEG